MATQLEAAELLLLRTAWMEDNYRGYEKESAMAKKYGFAVSVPHVFGCTH
jgi:alkylation response protein AidB-like acyl-CoA dehydrogenase